MYISHSGENNLSNPSYVRVNLKIRYRAERLLFVREGIILEHEPREEALLHGKMAVEGTLFERVLRKMARLFVKEK